jgi:DNA polymerase delta subunit 1
MQEAFELGAMASNEINQLLGPPMNLEFENAYSPYLLISKKRYAAMKWEDPVGQPKAISKGLVTVRRDNAPIVAKTASIIIQQIMDDSSREEYLKTIEDVLYKMENRQVDLADLTITKELKKWDYVTPNCHGTLASKITRRHHLQDLFKDFPDNVDYKKIYTTFREISKLGRTHALLKDHDSLANVANSIVNDTRLAKDVEGARLKDLLNANPMYLKLFQFDLYNEQLIKEALAESNEMKEIEWDLPKLGDRIDYVIVETKKNLPIVESAEDPRVVGMNLRKIDLEYYMSNQLKNPLTDLLQHVVSGAGELFSLALRKVKNKKRGQPEINTFFKKLKPAEAS